MTVGQLIRKGLFGVLNSGNEDSVINNVFSCDLLSLAMTKDLDGCAWFTVIGNVKHNSRSGTHGCVLCCALRKGKTGCRTLCLKRRSIILLCSFRINPVFDSAAELYAITDV